MSGRYVPATPSRIVVLVAALGAGCDVDSELDDRRAVMGSTTPTSSSEKFRQVCGSGSYVHGIDVSKWQSSIDWDAVAGAKVGYAFIRSSYGRTGADDRFDANWEAARAAGVLRGAYHYFNPAYDGASQAANMLEQFDDPNDLGELPLVLDVEERTDAPAPEIYAARVAEFVDAIETATGRPMMIYSGGSMWDTYLKSTAFADLPIWVAHYFNDRSTSHCPNTPSAWAKWTFWQHSEMGSVAGIGGAVDLDVFDGSEADLLSLTFHRADVTATTFGAVADAPTLVRLGECVDAWITIDNTGGIGWDAGVGLELADGASLPALESPSWESSTRIVATDLPVDVGESATLAFELCGGSLGLHRLALDLVDPSGVSFSAANQGGPSVADLTFQVEVVEPDAPLPAPTTPGAPDPGGNPGHGGCSAGESASANLAPVALVSVFLVLARRRPTRSIERLGRARVSRVGRERR